ncbi:MAG: IS66 family transposase, partial [Armatimonadetes bacterium]
LHRLEGLFKRYGHPLPKQVMWDMLKRVDELVARPVLRQMKRELLQEEVLHSDETPVTMRQEGGKGTLTGYAWEWRSLRAIETPKVLLEFKTSRGRDGPIRFLEDWSGTLITDGYSGFDEVTRRNGIVRAGCWAHARRKVKKALDQGIRDAVDVMRPVQRLFWLERAIDRRVGRLGMDQAAHLALRQEIRAKRCVRVIERIYEMVDELLEKRSTLPKSLLGKALKYLSRQKRPLSVFLDDPRVPIHNNDTERDLRHLAVGRKNWLVFGSQRGGDVACRLYSLVLSCKQAGVDPETYIEDLLGRISTTPASEIASLMPWAWAEARPSTAPATA